MRKHRKHGPSGKTRRDYVPLPLFRQGPYLIEITQDGLRLTPRPGTRAYKYWQEKNKPKEVEPEVIFIVVAFIFLMVLSHYV